MSAVVQSEGARTPRTVAASEGIRISKRGVTIAIILTELILLYLLLDGGSWVYDDNLAMALAGHSGLTWSWLTSIFFQHWGIGYHFVYALLHDLMPIDYRWALVIMLALLGGSMYLLQRVISMLFGVGWVAVFAAAVYGLSIFFVGNLNWLASGLQYLPSAFFDLLCLYAYVRYEIDGSTRWVAVSAGGLAGGLLFFEKPAFMLLYLVMLRALFMSDDLRPRTLLAVFWRERLMWAALLGVTIAWAIGDELSGGGSAAVTGTVTLGQYLEFFRIMWVETLMPGLVGVTVPAAGLSFGQILFVVALQVGVIIVVALSVHRKRSAWRAWAFLAVSVILSGLLVARARIPIFGVGDAAATRYLVDFAWLFPLAACFAFVRDTTVAPRLEERKARLAIRLRFTPASVAIGLTLLAYFVAAPVTAAKIQRQWAGAEGRAWEGRLETSLGTLQRGGTHVVLADGLVPFYIVAAAFAPYDQLSFVAPLYDPDVQVGGVLDGPLVTAGPDGTARRATIAGRLGNGAINSLIATHQLTISRAIRVVHRPSDTCVTADGAYASIERTIPGPASSVPNAYYLLISYGARQAANLPVFIGPAHGPVGPGAPLGLTTGTATNILYLGESAPRSVELELNPGNTMCISRMDVVTLAALPSSG